MVVAMDHFKKHIRAYVVTLLVILSLLLIASPASRRLMRHWHLLPQTASYQELFFTEPKNLPKTYHPGSSQTVKFSVRNHGGQGHKLRYSIIESGPNGSNILDQATFMIGADSAMDFSRPVTPADLGPRTSITVSIDQPNTDIHYLTDKT
jgi:hypothetical protein